MSLHLKTLVAEAKSTSLSNGPREKMAQDALNKGITLLTEAHQENFKDLQKLTQAGQSLISAIQYARNNPQPYLAMAYIFVLLENDQAATQYLLEVRRIAPDNPDAVSLLELITERTRKQVKQATSSTPSKAPAFKALPESPAEIDYDTLYDKVEQLILEEVRNLGNIPPVEPVHDARMLKQLAKSQKEFQSLVDNLKSQLDILNQEIDIYELETKLKPLEVISKRYQNALEISHQLLELLKQIEAEQELVAEQIKELHQIEGHEDLKVMEENLEDVMDHTDQFADQIETLSTQGGNTLPLEKRYENLVGDVEKLQEALDDIADKLHQQMETATV